MPMNGRGLAVVPAKAEGVTGWVEKHPDVLLQLVRSHRCPERNGLGDRGVKVADLEVEVHHRTLLPLDGRPYGGLIAGRPLEHDVDGSRGRGEDGRTWFLVPDRPAEQPGVEPRQCAGVRRLDGGTEAGQEAVTESDGNPLRARAKSRPSLAGGALVGVRGGRPRRTVLGCGGARP
jgi:hypothetical protein